MNVTVSEVEALVTNQKIERYPVLIIAQSAYDAAQFAQIIGLRPQQFKWVTKPEDVQGRISPHVIILPNWWRHDYTGMEEMLQQVRANIKTVHFGRKPKYKNKQPYQLPRH